MNDATWTTEGLPDFIIIGAQKSGTSSLHHVLTNHPDVYIPEGEVFFFDVDDADQHPDFFRAPAGTPEAHDFDRDFEMFARWYRSLFASAAPGQRIGEDSTTYLASRLAPARIHRLLPDVRLLVVLRDPADRAYSHYWHGVGTGRSTLPFERQLRERPGNLLERGHYREHLERYLALFDRERVHIVLFEDFIADSQRATDEACAFLGLDGSVDVSSLHAHRNAARPPRHLPTRLWLNRTMGAVTRKSYAGRLPHLSAPRAGAAVRSAGDHPLVRQLLWRWEQLQPRRRYPPMDPSVRAWLDDYYRQANRGLSELLQRDLSGIWGSGS